MKLNKIGLLALGLILALGLTGAGFASWTDELTIGGNVTTGTLGYEINDTYSGTWVYKDVPNHDVVVKDVKLDPIPPGYLLVASAEVTAWDPDTNTITMEYDNIFPCINFTTDFTLHYIGSVPARVQTIDWNGTSRWLLDLQNDNDPTSICELSGIALGDQFHYCDTTNIKLTIHLPQDDALQGLNGTVQIKINLVQFDKYGVAE